jgi:cytoskeletal protein CcmA (bactofilin family)
MFRKKDQEPTPATAMPSSPPPVATPLPTRAAPPAAAAAPAPAPRAVSEASAGKRLIVGQGLSLSGDITACDLLIVEGNVQVTLNETKAIEITETGRFTNGKAAVEEATISGVYEGELTVRGRLLVRGTGRVDGKIRYGELEVERGGRLSGTIEILSEMSSASAPAATPINRPAEPSLVGAEQG